MKCFKCDNQLSPVFMHSAYISRFINIDQNKIFTVKNKFIMWSKSPILNGVFVRQYVDGSFKLKSGKFCGKCNTYYDIIDLSFYKRKNVFEKYMPNIYPRQMIRKNK